MPQLVLQHLGFTFLLRMQSNISWREGATGKCERGNLCGSSFLFIFYYYFFLSYVCLNNGPLRVLAAAAKKAGQDGEGNFSNTLPVYFHTCALCAHAAIKFLLTWFAGLNGKAENGSDGTNKDKLMPDLCVICLEQEYNSVFVP